MAWLRGWRYRKELTISSGKQVTDYQVKILVGEKLAVTADVVCDCDSSFKDIRFTSEDGVTLLDYWIEEITGSASSQIATVWVKVKEIPLRTNICIYYGNPLASSVSSGVDTFLFFDDASVNNASSFPIIGTGSIHGNGTVTWSDGSYSVNITKEGHILAKFPKISVLYDVSCQAEVLRSTDSSNQQGGLQYYRDDTESVNAIYIKMPLNELQINGSIVSKPTYYYPMPQNTWKKVSMLITETTVKSEWRNLDGTLIREQNATLNKVLTNNNVWGMFSAHAVGSATRFRKILIRKKILPEPTVALKVTEYESYKYYDTVSDFLIQQYKDGEDVKNLVDMYGARMREISTLVSWVPELAYDINTAEGVQLDNIGHTVDAGRGSLSDANYREWISFIQQVNSAGGNPEIIIEYINRFLSGYIEDMLFDEGNGAVNIQLLTSTLPINTLPELVYQLSRIVPAGVEVRLFHSDTGDVFAVADEGTDVTVGEGFSEDKDESPYTSRTTGGLFIDPVRI